MQYALLPSLAGPVAAAHYPWGRETIVIHDHTRSATYGRHTAPLSLKAVLRGGERYNVHGFHETVEPGECLVVNGEQEYASVIDSDSEVETLCVFFSHDDVHEAASAPVNADARLDDPRVLGTPIEFAAVKRPMSTELREMMGRLPGLRTAPRLAQQSFSLRLLHALVAWERPYWLHSGNIDAVRASTRAELYRRCAIGRAYLEAAYAEDISLNDLAELAGLSRDHFLCAYRQCFGETPYQALRRIRLTVAATLLAHGGRNVSEVALAVGYENFSAFARAFRQFHGVRPSSLEPTFSGVRCPM